jgi:hypothetical protein
VELHRECLLDGTNALRGGQLLVLWTQNGQIRFDDCFIGLFFRRPCQVEFILKVGIARSYSEGP